LRAVRPVNREDALYANEAAVDPPTIGVTMLLELFDGDYIAVAGLLDAASLSIQEDLHSIERCVKTHDAKSVVAAAHRLKGTSGSITSLRLTELSSSIERSARAEFMVVAPARLVELREAVDALKADVESYASNPRAFAS
jgi:HPt (histidine-containing phosphotransfer) domain-containing protein